MDLGLADKSVFVAAGSKGLGKAAAQAFAQEGARVTIASRNIGLLEEARDEILAATGELVSIARMDVLHADEIKEAIELTVSKQGGLDVLVTNTGGPPGGTFQDMDDEAWVGGFELCLLSCIRLIRTALPYLQAAGGGRIVNLASSSIKQPINGLILSNVYRAGVQALTKSLATELAAQHVLINTVAPGRIATDRITELDQLRASHLGRSLEEVQAEVLQQIPLGRMGEPEEFARVVAFYGSFANSYITGQSVLVDGGMVKAI